MTTDSKAVLYGSLAVLSWSTVATSFKIALKYLTHYEMLLVASTTALVIFLVLITVQQKWGLVKRIRPSQWGLFALLGLLNPVAYYLVLFKAYHLLPAQVAQPINYAWPIVLLVLLALFTRQPIPGRKYIGMFLSLGGVALISAGGGSIGNMGISVTGLLLAAASAFLWALYWIVNNRLKGKIDSEVVFLVSFLFGTLYLWVGACWVEVKPFTLPGILSGMYVGAFEMGIPFLFFGLAMRTTSNPVLINQLCYLAPFLSLILISLVLHERIVTTTYIGLLLIIIGIVYNEYFAVPRIKTSV